MTNAAIYIHADAIDTTGPRLMGRHSAGESFLRGFIRHAEVDRFYFYDAVDRANSGVRALVDRIELAKQPASWIRMRDRRAIGQVGCLSYPMPGLPAEAWARLPFGSDHYSICGVTHTTASQGVMDIIADMATAPVQSWDGLITTSRAVRASVEYQIAAVQESLKERLGATRFPKPEIRTIPLGVNAADFAPSADERKRWRDALNIPQDAVTVLYVGRLHIAAKMNPAMMAMTLEETAKRTGKPIYWVVSGWGVNDAVTARFHEITQALCPSVQYRAIDGRPTDTRFSIWSAADIFLSFSDNIQETFGLTPVEAMAAGLPCVVTDWDGYRDTVSHGVDGFRIRTFAPRPGLGRDLAYQHANDWSPYELYLVSAAQLTAMDNAAAVDAMVALVNDPDLRRRMGDAGRRHARSKFDWAHIIPEYQAFWAELSDIRLAAKRAKEGGRQSIDNPRRLDPFALFQSYPTELLQPGTTVKLVPGMTWEQALLRLRGPLATIGNWPQPSLLDMEQAFSGVLAKNEVTVAEIVNSFATAKHSFIERGLLWLVKFGVLSLQPQTGEIID